LELRIIAETIIRQIALWLDTIIPLASILATRQVVVEIEAILIQIVIHLIVFDCGKRDRLCCIFKAFDIFICIDCNFKLK